MIFLYVEGGKPSTLLNTRQKSCIDEKPRFSAISVIDIFVLRIILFAFCSFSTKSLLIPQ